MAAHLYESLRPKSAYYHKTSGVSPEEYQKLLMGSATVYIGNLSFFTREEAVYELFSRCGEIKLLKMGLNKKEKTPCGFCFVEYFSHEDAAYAVDCLNGTQLDERQIRVDWDIGFTEGRQWGRGRSGGQTRDEHRRYDDPGRTVYKPSQDKYQRGQNTGEERKSGSRDYKRNEQFQRDYRSNRRDFQRRDEREYDKPKADEYHEPRKTQSGGGHNQNRYDSDSDQEEQNYRRKKIKE